MTALRPYQKHDCMAILACLQRGVKGTLYTLPTGGGKTRVAAEVIRTVVGMGWRVGFFVHRRELLAQASRHLHGLGVEHGLVAPGHALTTHPVHVASVDTIGRRIAAMLPWLWSLHLVVIDEAHHCQPGNKWDKVTVNARQAQVLGLTATPFRGDGKGLGHTFQEAISGPGIRDLTKQGHLSPAVVYAPPETLDLRHVRKRGGDYVQHELAAVMDNPNLIEPAVRHYARFCAGTPAIAFCASVDHAVHTAQQFRVAGWRAEHVSGDLPQPVRDERIAAVANGRLHVLTSCDLISEGTDIPAIGAAILLRPTQSTNLYVQQIGRSLRVHRDKNEPTCVLDCVRNSMQHGMPDALRAWNLSAGVSTGSARETTRRCAKCWRVHEWAAECPGCGHKYRIAQLPTQQPGDLAALTDAEIRRLSAEYLKRIARTEADLRRIQAAKGYKPGWVYFAARELRTTTWRMAR